MRATARSRPSGRELAPRVRAAGPWGRGAAALASAPPTMRAGAAGREPHAPLVQGQRGRGSQLTARASRALTAPALHPAPEAQRAGGAPHAGASRAAAQGPEVAKPPSPESSPATGRSHESPDSLLLAATPRCRQGPIRLVQRSEHRGTSGCSLQGGQLRGSKDLQAPLPTSPEQLPG